MKQGRARQAGIVEMEAPLHRSNVMLYCPSCNSATRVGSAKRQASATRSVSARGATRRSRSRSPQRA
ncbi:MAG: hypothetical protein U0232_07655 [Thermomicrobiales bacterium]